ncbi:MAG: glycosyltransferase involved in cell wall biosynthesis [Oceanospirillaceae bacterium]|jgi:glycosyltransferase involved in cell wall biosynthesis
MPLSISRNQALATMQTLSTVVVIGYVWPEPNSSAAGSRMMQLLAFFKQRSERVIFASPAQLGEHRVQLNGLDIEEQNIELNCESFDHWINQLQPELVLFDRFMMEEQFGWRVEQQCPNCIRILDTEDLHSLREARHQLLRSALKANREIDLQFDHLDTVYQIMVTTDVCQREIAAILRCDLTLMISEFEIYLLTQKFNIPQGLLLHLPFMLEKLRLADTNPDANHGNEASSTLPAFSQRAHFVTIGNFRHAPNWDTILWLKQAVWPKIRTLMPDAQLHIYGAYPPKKATSLHNPKQGFYVQGWAEDAFEVLSQARVCLSPIRFGAGIKGKFTDAMLCSTPSITTSLGAESMHGDFSWPGAIHNSSDDIAKAASELYQTETLWQHASDKGATILDTHYNKAHLSVRLEAAVDTLQKDLTALRLNNFTGMMLRHHHHKSTKYMAQWIAAKNNNLK